MSRFSLRARLTALVTVLFGLALSAAAAVGVARMESSLKADTRRSAEAVLTDYLRQLRGGAIGLGDPDPEHATRFVYLDADGNDLTNLEFQRILFEAVEAEFDDFAAEFADAAAEWEARNSEQEAAPQPPPDPDPALPPTDPEADQPAPDPASSPASDSDTPGFFRKTYELGVDVGDPSTADDSETPTFVHRTYESSYDVGAPVHLAADGDPELLDRGDDVIAVGYPVTLGDTEAVIAVSSPLKPVTDSVAALSATLLFLVPGLTAAIAAAAWLIIGRTLRPVDAITAQVNEIGGESLDERVPQPAADDEIGHLASTMNRMLDRLQQARDTQRQWISDASHELRSPITATLSTLEVARSHPDKTNWAATADTLHDESARLAALVDDLLLLARLDETGTVSHVADVDLDELCLSEAGRPHPSPVHVHIQDPVRVAGSLPNLTRALRNLVDNAARHAAGRVDITLGRDNGAAIIHVDDDGPGIPEERREQIFDRFSRLDESRHRANGEGAGLGLAIAKGIITRHQGTLTVDESPRGGARLTITLPVETG